VVRQRLSMNSSDESIALAERQVAERRAALKAQYQALEGRVRRTASSPIVLVGVLLGAIVIAYFAVGRIGKPKAKAEAAGGSLLTQVLRTAQLALPLIGALKAAQEAKSARKTVSRATGTPEATPDDKK
jgi:hypothetical protein